MRILIATDGSEFSKAAIDRACDFVNTENVVFKVVSVFEDVPPVLADPSLVNTDYYQHLEGGLGEMAKDSLRDADSQIRKCFSGRELDITTEVLRGFPDKEIVESAKDWKADLIVVGSHGRGFWGRMLGSVSDGVLHHAPCSVLVVRKPDSPDT